MLLNGGRLGNIPTILSPKTVEYMISDQLGPEIGNSFSPLGSEPDDAGYGFGLGVAVRRHIGIAELDRLCRRVQLGRRL